ncbi:MAG TPA: ParB/RepB/Spo0J family partition protein [Candidatus Limnocylindrales bacterium]|nr:ParB/RepB/Spo0J family partition protein [Candidatus Limnocylindrales bacterium]
MTDTTRARTGGLGRGLAALIPQRPDASAATEIPLERIRRNPYQPRQRADAAALEQLVASIREHGVLQPVLVTETVDGYQLIAGERRLRAAEMAGLQRIPAVVRQVAGRAQLELALVENLQRADLNALEEAHAYRQLMDEFGLGQEEVATRVGRARSTVANTLRLLDLAPRVQQALADGSISEGHARAIAALEDHAAQETVLAAVLERGHSVRQAEALVRSLKDGRRRHDRSATLRAGDPELERVETDLRGALGTKVTLRPSRRGGRIIIEYYGADDLGRIYERLVGGAA